MNWLKSLTTNPFSIATAIVHWFVGMYCILFEDTNFFPNTISSHRYDPVLEWLEKLNFFPLFIINLAGDFLDYVIGLNVVSNILLGVSLVLLITFQWMIVGYFVSRIFNLSNSKEIY